MEKIIVIGSPGAGKSSFSKKLKNITKLPLYHIDMLYHKKDGTHITKEELEEKLKEIFKTDKWIIDGNYQKTLELRMNVILYFCWIFQLKFVLKVQNHESAKKEKICLG